jgi:hypothetical protein
VKPERWDVRPLGQKREMQIHAAVIEADAFAACQGPHRERLADLACIVRGWAGLIIGPQGWGGREKTPDRVAKLADALARARRVAAGKPERGPG